MREEKRKKFVFLIIIIGVLGVRFCPMIIGLEWRKNIRIFIDLLGSIILICCYVCCVRLKGFNKRWIVIPLALVVFFLIYQGFSPCVENVIVENDVSVYVRENNDPGSLANVRYYKFVNEVFRGLCQVN